MAGTLGEVEQQCFMRGLQSMHCSLSLVRELHSASFVRHGMSTELKGIISCATPIQLEQHTWPVCSWNILVEERPTERGGLRSQNALLVFVLAGKCAQSCPLYQDSKGRKSGTSACVAGGCTLSGST